MKPFPPAPGGTSSHSRPPPPTRRHLISLPPGPPSPCACKASSIQHKHVWAARMGRNGGRGNILKWRIVHAVTPPHNKTNKHTARQTNEPWRTSGGKAEPWRRADTPTLTMSRRHQPSRRWTDQPSTQRSRLLNNLIVTHVIIGHTNMPYGMANLANFVCLPSGCHTSVPLLS